MHSGHMAHPVGRVMLKDGWPSMFPTDVKNSLEICLLETV